MSERVVSAGDFTPEQRRVLRVEHILRRDGGSPGSSLEGLASIIEDGDWRRVPSGPDSPEPFASFTAFVEAAAPFGLGYSIRQLRALLNLQHPDEEKKAAVRERMKWMRAEVEKLLMEEIKPVNENRGATITERNTRSRDTRPSIAESDNSDYIVSRLKRDDPELAEKVIKREITPNAAARAKGWRRARIVVSTPERVAVSLRKHMSPDARHALARLLLED